MSLFFVNESGIYDDSFISTPPRKVQIKIGPASLNLFAVGSDKTSSGDSKTLKVDFIDETFQLNNYYLALTGRGCGIGVYNLGRPVDTRTEAQKLAEDPDLFTVKAFTSFDDVEYNFQEFINTLKLVFPVQVSASIDESITRDFSGTFRTVLDSWCSYLGFGYFFENGILKIFDPSSLSIAFPSIPADALESSESKSIENTYDRTAWNYFSDEGGEITIDSNSNYLVTGLQMYPVANIFSLKEKQPEISKNIDVNQLIAAQYGQEFWLIYNIYRGTSDSICGFNPNLGTQVGTTFTNWVTALNSSKTWKVALLNEKKFSENYEFYKSYGDSIQGKLYVSNQINGIERLELFSWYDQGNGQIFNIDVLRSQPSPQLSVFSEKTDGVIAGTFVNSAYQGVVADGQRFYYFDQSRRAENFFALTDAQKASILFYFKNYVDGQFGNAALDYGDGFSYILFEEIQTFSEAITSIFDGMDAKQSYFAYRTNILNLKGLGPLPANRQYNPTNETNVRIIDGAANLGTNVSTIKAYVDSDLVAFYSKYEDCKHISTNTNALNRQFFPRNISDDIPIDYSYEKSSDGALKITRDFSYFDTVSTSSALSKVAQAYTVPARGLSFSLNYFNPNVPTSLISNGLVGININIQQDGMVVNYSYSNEIMTPIISDSEIDAINRAIKNSWIRGYMQKRRFSPQ